MMMMRQRQRTHGSLVSFDSGTHGSLLCLSSSSECALLKSACAFSSRKTPSRCSTMRTASAATPSSSRPSHTRMRAAPLYTAFMNCTWRPRSARSSWFMHTWSAHRRRAAPSAWRTRQRASWMLCVMGSTRARRRRSDICSCTSSPLSASSRMKRTRLRGPVPQAYEMVS